MNSIQESSTLINLTESIISDISTTLRKSLDPFVKKIEEMIVTIAGRIK